MIKKTLLIFCSILFISTILEISFGYLFYLKDDNSLSLLRLLRKVEREFNVSLLTFNIKDDKRLTQSKKENKNFFISGFKNEENGYRLHPYINYSNVMVDKRFGFKQEDLDYFGFRNSKDLYFDTERHYKLIVITGGSEVAGFSHKTTIAESIEKQINNHFKNKKDAELIKYKVLNLGMNSYSVSDEISSYVHLIYHLKPEFIISHSGYNDFNYASQIPKQFGEELGLNFMPYMYCWTMRMVYLKKCPKNFYTYKYNSDVNNNKILNAYKKNVKKFKTIVEENDGTFIFGLQGYEMDFMDQRHKGIKNLYDLITNDENNIFDINFVDFKEIKYDDNVHSNSANGPQIIAKAYVDLIIDNLN